MDDRLTELETRIAFQDGTLQTLNDVVTRQQDEIDRLARALGVLKEEMGQLVARAATSVADELPPHY
ncbi:MAG TPA: SlyX family protein [Acidiferrobacteraceae bacterium]|nr:SlyX family protein [Acidiferrobacteraceae bacterium]